MIILLLIILNHRNQNEVKNKKYFDYENTDLVLTIPANGDDINKKYKIYFEYKSYKNFLLKNLCEQIISSEVHPKKWTPLNNR